VKEKKKNEGADDLSPTRGSVSLSDLAFGVLTRKGTKSEEKADDLRDCPSPPISRPIYLRRREEKKGKKARLPCPDPKGGVFGTVASIGKSPGEGRFPCHHRGS